MIREKAKGLLTKLKQGTGSATIFGSSYYDEETQKIIQVITNENKATIVKKDGAIRKYESDIYISDVREIIEQLLSDKNSIKNSLVCKLTRVSGRNIPGIMEEVTVAKKVNERGIPYIDIDKPLPDNFHEIVSGQINREELERQVIKPYLARVCKDDKKLSRRHFISRIFNPLNRKEITDPELIKRFEDYLRTNTDTPEKQIKTMSKYFVFNILGGLEQEIVNNEIQGKSVSQKGRRAGYNDMIQNMSNDVFDILNILPNPNDGLEEIKDIYANTVGQLEALSVEPQRNPELIEEQIKNINRNINRHRQKYYDIGGYKNVDVGLSGKDVGFTRVQHVEEAMRLYSESIAILLEQAEGMSEQEYIKKITKLHFRFVQIHPFPEGNGRTARAISNMLLLEKGLVAVFDKEDKTEYNRQMNRVRGVADTRYLEGLYTDQAVCSELEEEYAYLLEEHIGIKCLNKEDLYKDRAITELLPREPRVQQSETEQGSR